MTAAMGYAAGLRTPQGRASVRDLVFRHGWNTMAYQILNPGIDHWFAPGLDAVVGYVRSGNVWVAAGAPICPTEHLAEAAAAFETAATQQNCRICYFGAQERLADLLTMEGPLARLLLGAQPVWHPAGWPDILAHKASLRAQISRARNKGVTVVHWPGDLAANHPALRGCLDEWLANRGLPPMRFLVEPDTLDSALDRRVLVARRGDAVLAYLVATPIPRRNGWLIEQIVRGHAAPNGTAELLIDAAMRSLADEGASYLTLGLSPLSQHAHGVESAQWPWMRLLLAWARIHGKRFYNFTGLDAFKAKLQPDTWEPVYLLSHERHTSLRTLYAVAGAFGGASPPLFLGHALFRAAAQELRWAMQR